ncbi:MAG: hypothetical protein Kow0070_22600 [Anaerolineales bacterium]|jgi:hypothetical protein
MVTTILFILPIAFILWALSKTTEKVLAIRQSEREAGKEPFVYL